MKHLTFCVLLGLGLHAACVAQSPEYTMTVEATPATDPTNTVYRFYVNAQDPTDKISSVFGNDSAHLVIYTPDGIFNSDYNGSWNASGITPTFVGFVPELADDSYATIGLDGPASLSTSGSADPSIVQDAELETTVTEYFTAGGDSLSVTTLTGAAWYVLNTAANALPLDGRWLVAQVTTSGSISGQMNFQIFPLGVGANQVQTSITFDGAGTFSENEGVLQGCTDSEACNFDASATEDDGSCTFILEGNCDCEGNELDALGICGGDCEEDLNLNGVCDDTEIVGCMSPTACNYEPQATIDSGDCQGIPTNFCDCEGSVPDVDNDGICDEDELPGCDDPLACNYDVAATDDDGSCDYCSCAESQYTLTVDTVDSYNPDFTVYRLYVNTNSPLDELSAVFGTSAYPLSIQVPEGIYNHPEGSWNASGINPGAMQDLPELRDDSYVTIGLDGPAAPLDGNYADPLITDLDGTLTTFFTVNGGVALEANTDVGLTWFVQPGVDNALPNEDGRILVAQITTTTTGSLSGTLNYQVFPLGNQSDVVYMTASFDGMGVFGQVNVCGCTEPGACNYDDSATIEDESCEYASCSGCMEEDACNFDPTATLNVVLDCEYPAAGYDCDGNCEGADENMNMVCDSDETGCMVETACNFDSANVYPDNDACVYPESGYNCDGECLMDMDNDGVCDQFEVEGCTDELACNYSEDATDDDGSCVFAVGDCAECAEDGSVVLNDEDGDGVCDGDEIEGCFDVAACNYNPDVTDINNDLCEYADEYYDCQGNCVNDSDGDGVCDELEILGCTNAIACNYDDSATDDDGSCAFPGDACNDGDDTTINDVYDTNCDCAGVVDGISEPVISFGMFPNPSTGEVTLNAAGSFVGVTVNVTDATGRLVWSAENMAFQGGVKIDLSTLSNGTYNVMLSNSRGASVKRLTIQR